MNWHLLFLVSYECGFDDLMVNQSDQVQSNQINWNKKKNVIKYQIKSINENQIK